MARVLTVVAPLEHQKRTGESRISRTRIKQCSHCSRFHPHWDFLENLKHLDGLGSLCSSCRGALQTTNPSNADRQAEYYLDNPTYYQKMNRARYLERVSTATIVEEESEQYRHAALHPDKPFYSQRLRLAYDQLLMAKRLRKSAGKPTR